MALSSTGSSEEKGILKSYYDQRLFRAMRFNIPKGSRVLEVGTNTGDLLAALEPSLGVGIDSSLQAIEHASKKYPDLNFILGKAENLPVMGEFDAIVLSNLVGELKDVQAVLENLDSLCGPNTRIYITYYNFLWGPAIRVAEKLGFKKYQPEQNWLRPKDLENLLKLAGFEPVKMTRDLLVPIPLPIVSDIINDYLAPLPFLNHMCINEIVVGRKPHRKAKDSLSTSVVVACKDERGNIEEIVRCVPRMGKFTELIFVDGHSTDGTVEEIERCAGDLERLNPNLESINVMVQKSTGKGEAVRMGFDAALGDVLMILDADHTVRAEDLPKFFNALADGVGEMINGTRLVYPLEKEAMRFLNLLANHVFGLGFTWLLDQRLTDTLCGTKVLLKSNYEKIKNNRSYFGDFDPFGDFDLLFGAAKLNMKLCEVPIRYRARRYGDIKIQRFRHGLLLLKMSALAFSKFKTYKV
ncbi:MAG: glycosyltransferase [Deltaproteobacteria bacterium]|nr:glycosyltransferase [Deltaproteobacteria bacterium]